MTIQDLKQMYHIGLINYVNQQGLPKETKNRGIVFIEEPHKIGVVLGNTSIVFKPKFYALGAKQAYLLHVLTDKYFRQVRYHLTQSVSLCLLTEEEKAKHIKVIDLITQKYKEMTKGGQSGLTPPFFDKYQVTFIAEKPKT